MFALSTSKARRNNRLPHICACMCTRGWGVSRTVPTYVLYCTQTRRYILHPLRHTNAHSHTLVSQEAVANYITVLFCSTESSREAKANAFMFDFWLQHSHRQNCFHHALSPLLLSQ